MMKPKCILGVMQEMFYSEVHMTLECRDTQLWPLSGCTPMSLPSRADPIKATNGF